MLIVLQGMDACGKDGTIKHVMSGLNPQGCEVHAFKKPTEEELEHNFLWRYARKRAGAGPDRHLQPLVLRRRAGGARPSGTCWPAAARRRRSRPGRSGGTAIEDINNFERHLTRSGTVILKFFLHISKAEQRRRLLARLDDPQKHWKFSAADLAERAYWTDYARAYRGGADRDQHAVGRPGT